MQTIFLCTASKTMHLYYYPLQNVCCKCHVWFGYVTCIYKPDSSIVKFYDPCLAPWKNSYKFIVYSKKNSKGYSGKTKSFRPHNGVRITFVLVFCHIDQYILDSHWEEFFSYWPSNELHPCSGDGKVLLYSLYSTQP